MTEQEVTQVIWFVFGELERKNYVFLSSETQMAVAKATCRYVKVQPPEQPKRDTVCTVTWSKPYQIIRFNYVHEIEHWCNDAHARGYYLTTFNFLATETEAGVLIFRKR